MFINPHAHNKNKTLSFISTDSKDLYQKNLKKQDHNWIYRQKQILYKHNEFGFRSRTFENLDWKNCVVIFGCSNVYGTGLAYDDCFCSLMEKDLGRPVINFGIYGGSVELAFYNSLTLYNNFPAPAAIVQLWTSLDRYTNFLENKIRNVVPIHDDYIISVDWSKKSKFYVLADRTIWKDKTIYYESSFWNDTSDLLKIDKLPNITDNSRDLSHPGIESNKAISNFLIEKLTHLGLK